ncbi:hypothetical protein I302_100514 [Kwoniella bestiolae CBS 10118]|uniref:Transcription activator of gluconeogenesis ERT1 n=1 Tax=Kwoniella bestiolae CBS 10118 TaxID=1296100 RepID=A0A1B9G5D1_9TREE|nr:hypothetical protein I302_03887 [Kwoniella bestiolae CBS 10118]OCF26208.1 hypothetical protein I302_03887 [Kwoniella bestiolae CBS 10118]
MTELSDEEFLAAVTRMQERQMSWGRPTRSNSSGSMSSAGDSISTSPHQLNLTALAPQTVAGGTSNGSTPASIAGGSASGRGRPKGKGKAKVKEEAYSAGSGEHKARKKVAKACLACQKSHLTCDEQRPCTRCVKKGMADQCVEGVRKKAKYLLEGEERLAARPRQASSPSPPTQTQPHHQHQSSDPQISQPQFNLLSNVSIPQQPQAIEPPRLPDDVWLSGPLHTDPTSNQINLNDPSRSWNTSIQPQNNGFATNGNAANTEYQMLDSLFGNLSPIFPGITDPLDEAGRQMSMDGINASTVSSTANTNNVGFDQSWLNPSPGTTNANSNQYTVQPTPSSTGPSVSPGTYSDLSPINTTWPNQNQQAWNTDPSQIMLDGMGQAQNQNQNQLQQAPSQQNITLQNQNQTQTQNQDRSVTGKATTPAEVYRAVVKPYDYTQGYHILMDYLTKNFEQHEILRVARALASFRPSLIALQMPMSEEDEIFIEKSFQRTLIELEKLISYSATPTAVWRRTGEICYANPEFCKLVGKSDSDLIGKRTYIYELFSNPSVVAYWENFSVHAFENTTQNFFQPVGLAKSSPNGALLLDCTGCITIRRDVFDLPSVIIGQFLPIPTE